MTRRTRVLLLAGTAAAVFSSTTAAAFVSCTPEAVCAARVDEAARRGEKRELVVLVHGLGRTRLSMVPLARALERQGYDVLNWGYSSTSASIPELGSALAARLAALDGPAPERIHFVGHSLGNVIVRWVLANDLPETTGRVVMLAPPNQGSRAADRYTPWLGWLLRPLPELRTLGDATARTIPLPEGVEVAVIAGKYDGKVSVAESHLEGEAAHLVVPGAHTFIMNRPDVRRRIAEFLESGRFSPDGPGTPAAHPL